MEQRPFATVPATPAGHFKLCCYAAILHVIDRCARTFESQDAAIEQFPFLAGYINELAEQGLNGLTTAEAIPWWRAALAEWEQACPAFLPLRALREAAGLSYEAGAIYCCAGLAEEDPRFGVLFEAVQGAPGQHRATYGLLNAWWSGEGCDVRAALAHLLEARLLQVLNPDAPRVDWALLPTPAVWDALDGRPPSAATPGAKYRPPESLTPLDALIAAPAQRAQLALLPDLLAAGDVRTLVVRGPQRNGRKTLVGAVARALGRGVLEVAGPANSDDERWVLAGHLAVLRHALPLLSYDLGPGETAALPRLGAYDGPLAVVAGGQGGLTGAPRSLTLHLDAPGVAERGEHWRQALGDAPIVGLDTICERYRMTGGNIRQTASLARAYARLAGHGAVGPEHVRRAARDLNRQTLDTLAAPVQATGDWASLAVAAETRQELLLLESRCRHRERLPDAVGAELGGQLTTGVRALLSGPSGTGKTLAARILAAVLGMDLYRLDLSAVVNKYIGETEKNLSALLARAEELDVVLLIDEGDSLLAQRTNVQTSNDRYANLETNFLLQRLESYGGIVLITTNAGDRIDSAFQRRMDVVIEFRAPEAAERWAIWQLHLPPEHDVDPPLLREAAARCALTGGQIRNAVLHASVLALDEGAPVGWRHLERAVQREYRKMGAVCPLRPTQRAAGW